MRLSLQRNSTRSFLYAGFFGAAVIVGYGALKLISVRTIPVSVPVEQTVAPPSHLAVIARRPIHRGAVVKAEDLDTLPIEGVLPSAIQISVAAVVGKVATADIPANQFITLSQISADPGKAGLAMLVPAGFRAIALRTNDEVAVSNFIRPGDHVDIQLVLPEAVLPGGADPSRHPDGSASEAHTLLQDILVLSVGDLIESSDVKAAAESGSPQKADQPRTVTMALTPDQVSQFVLARSIGTMFLSLRNPTDPQSIVQDTATLKAIRGQTPASTAPLVEAKRPIELVTGNQTRTIYSVSPGSKP